MKKGKNNIIEVREAYKKYSKSATVLQGLNMTVEEGTIYGLLGSSGCGKTTLLSCLTGRSTLDSGSVTVGLRSRDQLGYMPQEIALVELFTVSETFKYFGMINGMTKSQIHERSRELLNLMGLPPQFFWKRTICSLSGGQERRVSLCVALLHDPILLVLDEPTVGLDPLIREKLWEHFIEMTEEQGKTIIITTHYLEETRKANTIGLMRNGVLLAEAPPMSLLKEHECDALEDVFLILSQRQGQESSENIKSYSPKKRKSVRPLQGEALCNYTRMAAQVYKNTCWIKRNVPLMLFMLVLPALLLTLFCSVFRDRFTGIKIAFVSEEVLPDSCLNPKDPGLVVLPCSDQSMISCRFVEVVGKASYDMVEYESLDLALGAFKKGNARALMHFPKNYSKSLMQRMSEGFLTPDQIVQDSNVDVYIDRAEVIMALMLENLFRDSFKDLMRTVMTECGVNPRLGEQTLKIENPVYGQHSPKFTHSAMAGFIIPAVFFFTSFLSSSSLGSEKISGFLERCLVSGVRFVEVVAAHAVVQVLMLVLQTAMVLALAYGVYDLPLVGNWVLAAVFMIIVQLQGMLFGFILGTVFDDVKNVVYVAVGTVLCLFLSCGMFWPLEGAHWTIYYTMKYSPIIMAVNSYHSVTLRGWALGHNYIIYSLISNIGFILVLMCIFLLVCKVKM